MCYDLKNRFTEALHDKDFQGGMTRDQLSQIKFAFKSGLHWLENNDNP
jgi:hypothetical protein